MLMHRNLGRSAITGNMRLRHWLPILPTVLTLSLAIPGHKLNAHPGPLNADGCHTNMATGSYHCHNIGKPRPSITYVPPDRSLMSASTRQNIPQVNPWQLRQPVLLNNAKGAYYYKGVVLAGDATQVANFLEYYGLTVKYRADYSPSYPIWAACRDIVGPDITSIQTVCVGVNEVGTPKDERIFSNDYANRVALKVFAKK